VGRLAEPGQATAAADLLAAVVVQVTKELSGFKDPQWSRYGFAPDFQGVRLERIGRGSLGTRRITQMTKDHLSLGGLSLQPCVDRCT